MTTDNLRNPNPTTNVVRDRPYIWVTWVTGLMAGTDHCQWAAWFRTHFMFAKRPDNKNKSIQLRNWKREHDEMVSSRAALMREDGWAVTIERQNAFKLEGRLATLAATPDLVAVRQKAARIVDAKSGDPREKDEWQVRIYMWGLTKIGGFDGIAGEVQYRGHSAEIGPPSEAEVATMARVLSDTGAEDPPPRTPSVDECEWCNILDCPDRLKPNEQSADASKFF